MPRTAQERHPHARLTKPGCRPRPGRRSRRPRAGWRDADWFLSAGNGLTRSSAAFSAAGAVTSIRALSLASRCRTRHRLFFRTATCVHHFAFAGFRQAREWIVRVYDQMFVPIGIRGRSRRAVAHFAFRCQGRVSGAVGWSRRTLRRPAVSSRFGGARKSPSSPTAARSIRTARGRTIEPLEQPRHLRRPRRRTRPPASDRCLTHRHVPRSPPGHARHFSMARRRAIGHRHPDHAARLASSERGR